MINLPITGYAEGYYGRLLSWAERRKIVDTLQRLGLGSYYYAPKEDPCHRLHWREPYSSLWHEEFNHFCAYAKDCGIRVVAGVAPGLDFDFADFPDGEDLAHLVSKSQALLDDGADNISLLMDDIDADFDKRCGHFRSEGEAHASLANALGKALSKTPSKALSKTPSKTPSKTLSKTLGKTERRTSSDALLPKSSVHPDNIIATSVWVTPRIYADELMVEDEQYVPDFIKTLDAHHCVLYCGSDVVARSLDENSAHALRKNTWRKNTINARITDHVKHRVIIWDNLYANDYCPRRLFTGPWELRNKLRDVLLNPTGMVHTDCLLLELMAVQMQNLSVAESEQEDSMTLWRTVLHNHGVPEAFHALVPFFYHPHFNDSDNTDLMTDTPAYDTDVFAAIEHCLWRWKTPLSREWYTFIFGLKHDLLTFTGQHARERILKTQNHPLARLLLKS